MPPWLFAPAPTLLLFLLAPTSSSFVVHDGRQPPFVHRLASTAFASSSLSSADLSSSPESSSSGSMAESQLLNSAFVFVKPHANNPKVQEKVREALIAASLEIKSEGDIAGTVIDDKKLIDQHYYAIASKATLLEPKDLAVPADKFEDFFGEKWDDVLSTDRAANAMQACDRLGVDAGGLEKAWRECEPLGKVVKFGGGFYCGLIEVEGKAPLYVFNAFFMSMRKKFTGDASIHYYEVEWKPDDLSWADFRGKVLGPTDPAAAPEGSIRNMVLKEWQDLGLDAPPNKGDNGVHASASPFEGLAEKLNWLGRDLKEDPFGRALLSSGIPAETLQAWSVDPRVELPKGEGQGSIFDALEDMDADQCLEKCTAIHNSAT